MIERTCEIVEIPGGGFAALMPLPDVSENHWVAVKEAGALMRCNGRVHLAATAHRVASMPWDEGWKPLGTRDVLVGEPHADYDLGGGD